MGLLDALGRFWLRVEALFARVRRRFRRTGLELAAGTRRIGSELWHLVEDLPLVPSFEQIFPLRRQLYGHGGYMGAAPVMLADRRWRQILAFLMPDVFRQVRGAMNKGAGPSILIPMFENNPVMCAYGTWASLQRRGGLTEALFGRRVAAVEWDVFLDSLLVARWARGELGVLPTLVDTMLVAHASTTDTLQEQLGICQYADVRKTPKTRLGGVEARHWIDLFARALQLADAPDLDAALSAMAAVPRLETDEQCALHVFAEPMSFAEGVAVWERLTGEPFSIVLEVKSLRSSPELLSHLVAELNGRGVHVAAVGSFRLDEIRGVGAHAQPVGEVVYEGPREILFLHYVGDLQHACDQGRIPQGQSVMFNGASLLDHVEGAYSLREGVIAALDDYRRRHELVIGFYVQEDDCDPAAASLLSELVDREPELFALGFAWGGLPDRAIAVGGGDRRGFGAQRILERLGRARHWRIGLGGAPPSPG